jgi:tetratricopeptide (TPR) repeat protein/TolB-like protein
MSPAVGTRFGRYEVLAPLGAGGMGEVFRARDCDLGREVAIKFLPSQYASNPERLARFAREARAASALNHPNIITIHEIGETDGQHYIVMELVEGETLRRLIQRGRVPLRQVLDLSTQIAEGLAKAHAAGIVHRDMKPENVMLTSDGYAKILDFGLAKLKAGDPATAAEEASEEVTRRASDGSVPGQVVGTTRYMSPEQAAGRPLDFRSDQFALGGIIYELLTGRRAFDRDSAVQTLAAIIEDEPPPLAEACPSLPPPARWIVERCLAKNPADRYASTLDLARELRGVREHLSEASAQSVWPKVGGGWRRRVRAWHVVLATVALVTTCLAVPPIRGPVLERLQLLPLPAQKRIAVLPVRCAGTGEEMRAVCDGLLDYVVARLVQLEPHEQSVAVVPASDIRQSGVTSAGQARRGLGATLAVDITLRPEGDQTLVLAGLLDTGDGHRQLRASTRRFSARDGILLDEVVKAVVDTLDLPLGAEERSALRSGTTAVPEASSLYARATSQTPYLLGATALERADQRPSFEEAIELFNKALKLDPRFAVAHVGLAQAHLGLFRLFRQPQDAELAEAHARRALELDDLVPDGWFTLGAIHVQVGKFEQGLEDLNRALARNPRGAQVYAQIAFAYQRQNRLREAEETYQRAIRLEQDSPTLHTRYGAFLYNQGRNEEAAAEFRRGLDLAPDNVTLLANLGGMCLLLGRPEEARTLLQRAIAIHATGGAVSNLAQLEYDQQHYAAAAEGYERAAELTPRDYRVRMNVGSAYDRSPGSEQRARAAYLKAVSLAEEERRLDPHNAVLLAYMADIRAHLGEGSAARALLTEALALGPANGNVAETAAEVYEELGDRDTALRLLDLAFKHGYPRDALERVVTLENLRADPRYRALVDRSPPER